jgi:hypothetical protein
VLGVTLDTNIYYVSALEFGGVGTVAWPNGTDLDPDVLYARITATPILQEHDVHLANDAGLRWIPGSVLAYSAGAAIPSDVHPRAVESHNTTAMGFPGGGRR